MSKAERMRGLKTGNGIQYLIDEGHKILGNPINTFDTDYRLMAYSNVELDDRFWVELITTGGFGIEAQIFFMNECFTDDVANAEKLAMMKSDKLKYDRILGHVVNGDGIKVANVLMLESHQPFDTDTISAFDILVDLISKEIQDSDYYIAYAKAYQNDWIKKLIDYDIVEKGLYSPHLQILYSGFKSNLYVAVVDISRSEARHNGHQNLVDALRSKRNDFKYAIYDNYIVMLMSTSYKLFNIKRDFSGIAEWFEREGIYVGISTCFDNLYELRKYYAEAVQAIGSLKPHDTRHISVARK